MAGVAGLVLPRGLLQAETNAKSRVCIVEDVAATSGTTINIATVHRMVNAGIMSLGQAGDAGSAWKALLPGVSQTSKIALKVNTLYSSLPTHPAVAMAVVNSLRQMMFGGTSFPENNIIIYDHAGYKLTESGYTFNTSSTGIRCFGTDAAGVGHSSQTYNVAGKTERLSRIVTDIADYIINIAVLKNHSGSGVTHCLKNHYGSCDSPSSLHETYCSPYIAALSATAPIKAKQKVNIIDALFGAISGGPEAVPQFAANRLIMSTDVVAADYQGRKFLIEKGCTNAGDAYHVDVAATTYGLGTNDPAQMDVVRISNPTGIGDASPLPSEIALSQNYPNPFNPSTVIRYTIPRKTQISLGVYTMAGQLLTQLAKGEREAGQYEVRFDGSGFPSGVYVYRLKAGGTELSRKMLYLK
jgi:uncharacterized protein (DUF362 family)